MNAFLKCACMAIAVAAAPLVSAAQTAAQHLPSVQYEEGQLPLAWSSGAANCAATSEDFQVHAYNDNLYILRESGCVNAEKPFLYLLFGEDRALLFDTGAGSDTDPSTGRVPDVVGAVDKVINQWLAKHNRRSLPLVVAHLHSHADHTWGDALFVKRPNTTLVKPGDVEALKTFFGIAKWPQQVGTYDLGGRVLDIIPIPGHDATSIAAYDRQTAVLLTGDSVYPGRIYVNDADPQVTQDSLQRLVDFTRTRLVAHVLGSHIEQRAPYADNPKGQHYAPQEMGLALGRAHLLEMLEAAKLRTGQGDQSRITQKAYRDFTLCGVYPACAPVNVPVQKAGK